MPRQNTISDFWARVDRSGGPDSCWPWIGKVLASGYGSITIDYKQWKAHRLADVLTNGPITDDLVTMHTCDVRYPVGDISYRRCCNPAHTTRGSRADNNAWRDTMGRAAKGEATRPETRARGEAAALSKLTEVQVHEIRLILATTRLRYGHGYAAIGRQFDVGQQAIRDIHSGRTWRHVR